ncbi:monovalent cation/H(+) antiporter subunit G [Ostreibacterium oceani]|uniref:Na+/H+ antiporter subunit G n=1 Tax=Ostreibacterium oceani TaxID=2654998 RepID=A0A6N7EY84_9GAMM|nr:monovalent cation/H(+) antiporter subunit G [Ostreibacterium oceani]MPV86510.1 Na+/H+ antiporter subunit G [Ostreibacterium oceani]
MIEILSAIMVILGVIFVFIGAIGLLRLPDFYIRVSAITKAATAGVACIVIGVAIHADDVGVAFKALIIVVFLLITSPIAAHIIGRAAYNDRVPLWKKTRINEYEDYKSQQQAQQEPQQEPQQKGEAHQHAPQNKTMNTLDATLDTTAYDNKNGNVADDNPSGAEKHKNLNG